MTERAGSLVITIDGPAGSGKSSTAQEVARRLGLPHLDSGALYRAITLAVLEAGDGDVVPDELDEEAIVELGLEVDWRDGAPRARIKGRIVPDEDLRAEAVTDAVSRVSAVPAVRAWLLAAQRAGARGPGLVADGRDMGSVVFPDAPLKVYLQADATIRARRRLAQRGVEDPEAGRVDAEAVRLAQRDRQDMERKAAPLRIPPGALLIDTTELAFEEQVARIVDAARRLSDPVEERADG